MNILIDDLTQSKYEVHNGFFRLVDSWLADFKYVNPVWIMDSLKISYDVAVLQVP